MKKDIIAGTEVVDKADQPAQKRNIGFSVSSWKPTENADAFRSYFEALRITLRIIKKLQSIEC